MPVSSLPFSRGDVVPSASVYIPDSEKSCDSDPVVINRYIAIEAPPTGASPPSCPQDSAAQAPHTGACQQHYRCADRKKPPGNVVKNTQSLTESSIPSRTSLKEHKHRWICFRNMIQISNPGQTNCGKRLCTLSITQPGEERRVCYITLNRPEEEHSGPEDIPSVKAILNTLLPLGDTVTGR